MRSITCVGLLSISSNLHGCSKHKTQEEEFQQLSDVIQRKQYQEHTKENARLLKQVKDKEEALRRQEIANAVDMGSIAEPDNQADIKMNEARAQLDQQARRREQRTYKMQSGDWSMLMPIMFSDVVAKIQRQFAPEETATTEKVVSKASPVPNFQMGSAPEAVSAESCETDLVRAEEVLQQYKKDVAEDPTFKNPLFKEELAKIMTERLQIIEAYELNDLKNLIKSMPVGAVFDFQQGDSPADVLLIIKRNLETKTPLPAHFGSLRDSLAKLDALDSQKKQELAQKDAIAKEREGVLEKLTKEQYAMMDKEIFKVPVIGSVLWKLYMLKERGLTDPSKGASFMSSHPAARPLIILAFVGVSALGCFVDLNQPLVIWATAMFIAAFDTPFKVHFYLTHKSNTKVKNIIKFIVLAILWQLVHDQYLGGFGHSGSMEDFNWWHAPLVVCNLISSVFQIVVQLLWYVWIALTTLYTIIMRVASDTKVAMIPDMRWGAMYKANAGWFWLFVFVFMIPMLNLGQFVWENVYKADDWPRLTKVVEKGWSFIKLFDFIWKFVDMVTAIIFDPIWAIFKFLQFGNKDPSWKPDQKLEVRDFMSKVSTKDRHIPVWNYLMNFLMLWYVPSALSGFVRGIFKGGSTAVHLVIKAVILPLVYFYQVLIRSNRSMIMYTTFWSYTVAAIGLAIFGVWHLDHLDIALISGVVVFRLISMIWEFDSDEALADDDLESDEMDGVVEEKMGKNAQKVVKNLRKNAILVDPRAIPDLLRSNAYFALDKFDQYGEVSGSLKDCWKYYVFFPLTVVSAYFLLKIDAVYNVVTDPLWAGLTYVVYVIIYHGTSYLAWGNTFNQVVNDAEAERAKKPDVDKKKSS